MMKTKSQLVMRIGCIFLGMALLLTSYNLIDQLRARWTADKALSQLEAQIETDDVSVMGQGEYEVPDYLLNPEMDLFAVEINGAKYAGILTIPVLSLQLPVIKDWSYKNLKKAPCRYVGTPYKNNMVIAAHNYSSHFGNLKQLQQGDDLRFTDMDGNTFFYKVAGIDILMPDQTEEMQTGDWDLTLFTCTIGGRSRVTVRCVEV